MKTVAMLTLSLGLLAGTGTGLAAATCTEQYADCLTEADALWAPLRWVADFACFDDYTWCVYWEMLRG